MVKVKALFCPLNIFQSPAYGFASTEKINLNFAPGGGTFLVEKNVGVNMYATAFLL